MVDIQIKSSSARMIYVNENGDEFTEMDLNDICLKNKMLMDDDFDQFNSSISSFSFASVLDSSSEIESPLNGSKSLRQSFAPAIADLNMFFAHQTNDAMFVKPSEAKQFLNKTKCPNN